MLSFSNMFDIVVSAILLSTVTDLTHGLYVPHPKLPRAIVHNCTSGEYTKFPKAGYYKFHNFEKSWNDASATCTSEGGYLAVLNNEEEDRAVAEYVFFYTNVGYTSGRTHVWIGILDRVQDGGWHSVHGEPLNQIYHTWTEPRSNIYQACGALGNDGLLNDMSCENALKFVCEKSCPN